MSSLVIGGVFIASLGDCVFAQLVPDTTLGNENSRVRPISPTIEQINGGATRGANLFHSFGEFNVGEGRSAYFTNPAGIENILTRVTGTNPSNILGTLGVTGGNANLFLINPNGIIFGQNARLDVGGSFTATTANAIKLGDTGLFSASSPATSNLLTIRPSALFFNAIAPGEIVNQSLAESLSGQTNSLGGPVGLEVPTGQTLALIGGNVAIEGGNLTAAAGRIELGSVAGVGEVSLSQIGNRWLFGYDNIEAFGNIRLEGGAVVDASGEGGGDVQIQGAQLEMAQGSLIYAITLGSGDGGEILVRTTETIALSDSSRILTVAFTSGTGGDLTIATGQLLVRDGAQVGTATATSSTGEGGTLSITASDTVEVIGRSANGQLLSGLYAQTQGEGDAGDLKIATRRLLVRDGALVSARATRSTGKGGTLSVTASDTVEVIGGQVPSGLSASTEGEGNAGDLTITTRRLLVRDGAQVGAGTFGTGKGGTFSVTASDTVEVIGSSANGQVLSGLFTQTEGEGDAGNLTIATRRLLVRDGAQVSSGTRNTQSTGNGGTLSVTASDIVEVIGISANGQLTSGLFTQTQGNGDAGNLTIATRQLLVRDGAQVSSGSRNTGAAGTLSVIASDTVEVIGISANGRFPSILTVQTIGAGNAGNLTIATEQLTIRDRAEVNVSSRGTGIAGVLRVQADAVRLDNQGRIRANTSGGGGNINLSTDDLILRRGSSISTNARGSNITGGNIIIDTDNLVAVPKEDSDISANAENSFGGRVIVNASGIFGTKFRLQDTPLSDITASSALGSQFNGVVQLNTPDIDPSRGLANLPTEVVDASDQIDQTCSARGAEAGKNTFTITGRGGLPTSPYEPLSSDEALEDIQPPSGFSSRRNSKPAAARTVTSQSATSNPKPPIVEAQGWVMNNKGQVVLTATTSTSTPHNGFRPATCPSS